jgi:hypothetical protein
MVNDRGQLKPAYCWQRCTATSPRSRRNSKQPKGAAAAHRHAGPPTITATNLGCAESFTRHTDSSTAYIAASPRPATHRNEVADTRAEQSLLIASPETNSDQPGGVGDPVGCRPDFRCCSSVQP